MNCDLLARSRDWIRQLARDLYAARRAFFADRHALAVANLVCLPWLATILVHRDLYIWIPLFELSAIIFIYWFFTRREMFERLPVRRPLFETLLALLFTALWVLYRSAQYGQFIQLPDIKCGVCDDFADTILPKMIEMVFAPLAVWLTLRYTPRQIGLGVPTRAWIPATVPLLALLDWGLTHQTPAGLWTRTVCFYFGAGLPEEFLFRGILQSRLEWLLKQPAWGLFGGALIFGASHLPINLHGAGMEHWQVAFENAFTYQMGVGFALGYAFQRSRNLAPLTLMHALIDSAPLV